MNAIFEKQNQKYKQRLNEVFEQDQKRYKYQPASGRLFVETYDEVHERFDKKFKRLEN